MIKLMVLLGTLFVNRSWTFVWNEFHMYCMSMNAVLPIFFKYIPKLCFKLSQSALWRYGLSFVLFLAIKYLVFMLSRTQLSSALAESGVRVARRFTNEGLFVRSRSKMLLPRVGWSTTCVNVACWAHCTAALHILTRGGYLVARS